MLILHKTIQAVWQQRSKYHVLTYAEEGFAPLNEHTKDAGINKNQLVAFAALVNEAFEPRSLYPAAPVSAIPRALVRDTKDSDALRDHIIAFLIMNDMTFMATKIIFDFRTPHVEKFVIAAIEEAMNTSIALIVEEVIIAV